MEYTVYKSTSVTPGLIKVECENCGKPVYVPNGHFGCVFCAECWGSRGAYVTDSSD